MPDFTDMLSHEFLLKLPPKGRPDGFVRHYELRAVNADLFIYRCRDAEVAILQDGNRDTFLSEVTPFYQQETLATALAAWGRWYSARLTRIINRETKGEDYTGYEQDLFEALGCSSNPVVTKDMSDHPAVCAWYQHYYNDYTQERLTPKEVALMKACLGD